MTENEKKITAQENQQTIENEQNENQNEEPTFSISEICSKYIIEKLISNRNNNSFPKFRNKFR